MAKTYLGNLSAFDYKTSEWAIFKGRLTQFLKVNQVDEDYKSAILITHLSDDSYRLVRNLAHPVELEELTYKNLVELLDSHFKGKQCSFTDKAKFYGAKRNTGESLGDWAARIRGLASYCEFGAALEINLTDRFVLGLGPGPERDKLFEQNASTLSLTRALQIAECAESANVISTELTMIKDEAVNQISYIEKARNPESDTDYTSSEEIQSCRHRTKRRKKLTDSDASDGGELDLSTATIPKAYKSSIENYSTSKAVTCFENDSQSSISSIDSDKGDDDVTITENLLEKSVSKGLLHQPSDNLTSYDKDKNKEERLQNISEQQLDKSLMNNTHDDNIRRLQSLEEKSDTALNLLGTLVVGMKDILKQLAVKNNNVLQSSNKQDSKKIKDALPVETKEAIQDFEKMLSKQNYYREFTLIIQQIGGSDGKEFTERVFQKIFSALFAKNNTWDGKRTKYPIKDLTLINIIQELILSKFPFWSSSEFEKVGSNWFRLGNQRAGQQPAQRKKKEAATSKTDTSED